MLLEEPGGDYEPKLRTYTQTRVMNKVLMTAAGVCNSDGCVEVSDTQFVLSSFDDYRLNSAVFLRTVAHL